MDSKILWLEKKKKSSVNTAETATLRQFTLVNWKPRSGHGAYPGMFMVIVQILHHRWDYQPGAAPQGYLDLNFSSQVFSPAPAFLPQEGPAIIEKKLRFCNTFQGLPSQLLRGRKIKGN